LRWFCVIHLSYLLHDFGWTQCYKVLIASVLLLICNFLSLILLWLIFLPVHFWLIFSYCVLATGSRRSRARHTQQIVIYWFSGYGVIFLTSPSCC
jgi:hypothetical protein